MKENQMPPVHAARKQGTVHIIHSLQCLCFSRLKIIQRSPSFAAMRIQNTLWYYILKQRISYFFSLLAQLLLYRVSHQGSDSPRGRIAHKLRGRWLAEKDPWWFWHRHVRTHAHLTDTIPREDALSWGSPAPGLCLRAARLTLKIIN